MVSLITIRRQRFHGKNLLTLGLPKRFFIPWVIKKDEPRERASPNQPVCHSQSFLFHISDFGRDCGTDGPGTRTIATKKTMTAGMINAYSPRYNDGTFSLWTKGKLISGLMSENGLLFGDMTARAAPTPTAAIITSQSRT